MTPIEQINWDKQVKSGELSFGALKAELAEAKKQIEHAYIRRKEDLNRVSELKGQLEILSKQMLRVCRAFGFEEATIDELLGEVEALKEKASNNDAVWHRADEVARLKKRVNRLIRKGRR